TGEYAVLTGNQRRRKFGYSTNGFDKSIQSVDKQEPIARRTRNAINQRNQTKISNHPKVSSFFSQECREARNNLASIQITT
ncbi:hypothetical protein WUBG_10171, partial [Wuchereria bancrofti]